MKQTVETFIRQYHLLQSDGTVLTAISGGADSVALLHLLKDLGYKVCALHCNFHLRGEESDNDQHFVEKFCHESGIRIKTKHFNTLAYAEEHELSIEMAARELRYEWFREQLIEQKAQAIAVGHHMDDQAETLLINLLRGTGLRGLAGMHPRQGNIVRPLLCVNRKEIEDYLRSNHLTYITDSSNLKPDVLRNRIRLEVIPLLKDLQPSAPQTLARAAKNVGEALPYYILGIENAMTTAGFTENALDVEAYHRQECPITLLHEWLHPSGFNASQISDIQRHISGQPGKMWKSKTHCLLRDRGVLLLTQNTSISQQPVIETSETSSIGPTTPQYAYIDADLLTQPLHIRQTQPGDWFIPFGMKGRKLVSDFLTDQKLTRFQKERQWVLCHGADIVWVIGLRTDNRYRVTPQTRRIIQLKIQQNQPQQ